MATNKIRTISENDIYTSVRESLYRFVKRDFLNYILGDNYLDGFRHTTSDTDVSTLEAVLVNKNEKSNLFVSETKKDGLRIENGIEKTTNTLLEELEYSQSGKSDGFDHVKQTPSKLHLNTNLIENFERTNNSKWLRRASLPLQKPVYESTFFDIKLNVDYKLFNFSLKFTFKENYDATELAFKLSNRIPTSKKFFLGLKNSVIDVELPQELIQQIALIAGTNSELDTLTMLRNQFNVDVFYNKNKHIEENDSTVNYNSLYFKYYIDPLFSDIEVTFEKQENVVELNFLLDLYVPTSFTVEQKLSFGTLFDELVVNNNMEFLSLQEIFKELIDVDKQRDFLRDTLENNKEFVENLLKLGRCFAELDFDTYDEMLIAIETMDGEELGAILDTLIKQADLRQMTISLPYEVGSVYTGVRKGKRLTNFRQLADIFGVEETLKLSPEFVNTNLVSTLTPEEMDLFNKGLLVLSFDTTQFTKNEICTMNGLFDDGRYRLFVIDYIIGDKAEFDKMSSESTLYTEEQINDTTKEYFVLDRMFKTFKSNENSFPIESDAVLKLIDDDRYKRVLVELVSSENRITVEMTTVSLDTFKRDLIVKLKEGFFTPNIIYEIRYIVYGNI